MSKKTTATAEAPETCHVTTSGAAPPARPILESETAPDGTTPNTGFYDLPPSRIRPSSFNPRKTFEASAHEELTASVKEHGVIQALTVRPLRGHGDHWTGYWEVVCGERRWRAAIEADLESVPCLVRELDDTAALQIAVIENLQRESVPPIEEAEGLKALKDSGMSQTEIAEKIGRKPDYVSVRLALLELPEAVRAMITSGEISAGHGRALLKYREFPEVAAGFARAIIKYNYSVRDVEGDPPWNAISVLEQEKLAVRIIPYHIGAGHETCLNCPFAAYRKWPHMNSEYCLRPAHYQELTQAEHERRKDEEEKSFAQARAALVSKQHSTPPGAAETQEANSGEADSSHPSPRAGETRGDDPMKTAEPLKAAEPVNLATVSSNSYERVSDGKAAIDGCSPACPCRGVGIAWGTVSQICTDPQRLKKLKTAMVKKQNAEKKTAVAAVKRQAIDRMSLILSPDQVTRAIVFFAAPILFEADQTLIKEAAERVGVTLPSYRNMTRFGANEDVYDALARYAPQKVADFFGTLSAMIDAKDALLDFNATYQKRTHWFLAAPKTPATEQPAAIEQAYVIEPAPIAPAKTLSEAETFIKAAAQFVPEQRVRVANNRGGPMGTVCPMDAPGHPLVKVFLDDDLMPDLYHVRSVSALTDAELRADVAARIKAGALCESCGVKRPEMAKKLCADCAGDDLEEFLADIDIADDNKTFEDDSELAKAFQADTPTSPPKRTSRFVRKLAGGRA